MCFKCALIVLRAPANAATNPFCIPPMYVSPGPSSQNKLISNWKEVNSPRQIPKYSPQVKMLRFHATAAAAPSGAAAAVAWKLRILTCGANILKFVFVNSLLFKCKKVYFGTREAAAQRSNHRPTTIPPHRILSNPSKNIFKSMQNPCKIISKCA